MPRPAKDSSERLIPAPMRVTPLQMMRLERIATRDGLNIAEHQRRAVDVYCELYEKKHSLPTLTTADLPPTT